MLKRLRKTNVLFLLACLTACLVACDMGVPYFHYDHTQLSGWEKNDTLKFEVKPMVRPGRYATTLGLRVNKTFPYTNLSLIVEQTVYKADRKQRNGKNSRSYSQTTVHIDTVDCKITDKQGNMIKHGVSYYQYEFPTDMIVPLSIGDSVHYTVRHNMKRNILPGIADVGIKLTYSK